MNTMKKKRQLSKISGSGIVNTPDPELQKFFRSDWYATLTSVYGGVFGGKTSEQGM